MTTVHILHTNDLHSQFESMPSIATCMKQEKEKWERKGDQVVVVDIGDHMDRSRLKTEASWGQTNVEIMNATGYQLATLGNNEGLTFPKERLMHLYDKGKAQVLCCNFKDCDTMQLPPFIKPYMIQQLNDVKIGWTGVTASYPDFYRLLGWEVEDPIEALREVVAQLRPQVDILVVLSHIGLPSDRKMATEIEGIDLILGGHTHHLLEKGERVNDTQIAQVGRFGHYIGHVTMERQGENQPTPWTFGVECLSGENYHQDEEVAGLIDRHLQEAEKEMDQVVAVLDREMTHDWEQESPLGNMLATGLREWTDADIGMVNGGQFLFSLAQGPVTKKTLLSLCPHPINPCRVTLTGKQIKTVLEQALEEKYIEWSFRGFGFRGKKLGWMCVDGLQVTYDLSQPQNQRIVKVETKQGLLQEAKQYRVGTVDMFTFGVLFPTFTEGTERKYFVPEVLRDVVRHQLQNPETLASSENKRWFRVDTV